MMNCNIKRTEEKCCERSIFLVLFIVYQSVRISLLEVIFTVRISICLVVKCFDARLCLNSSQLAATGTTTGWGGSGTCCRWGAGGTQVERGTATLLGRRHLHLLSVLIIYIYCLSILFYLFLYNDKVDSASLLGWNNIRNSETCRQIR